MWQIPPLSPKLQNLMPAGEVLKAAIKYPETITVSKAGFCQYFLPWAKGHSQ